MRLNYTFAPKDCDFTILVSRVSIASIGSLKYFNYYSQFLHHYAVQFLTSGAYVAHVELALANKLG